jgi:hypothetical protein
MDPATLIVSALVAGPTDTAQSTVKDSREALKDQLQKRLTGNPDALQALSVAEKKPDSALRQEILKEYHVIISCLREISMDDQAKIIQKRVVKPTNQRLIWGVLCQR